MIKRCLLFILLVVVTSCIAININAKAEDFENIRVLRVVDLTTGIAKEDIGIRAKNTGTQATNSYYFVIPIIYRPFIASYHAHLKQGTKDPLVMESIGLDKTKQVYVYKIHLNKTLQQDEEIKIGINLVYTHLVRPLPEKIPQISKQHVSFANNIYLFSTYATDDMKTTYIFPTSSIVTFVGGEPDHVGEKSQNKIVYGSYKDIKPLSISPGNFHYEYRSPILTVTSLKREVEVSHWASNLAVEEHYALRHDGAKLEEEFNRLKFQLAPHILEQTNVLTNLVFQLPKDAKDVYYRDEVGNVSTSHFRNEKLKSVLELQPRFPLFGGWKTTWYTGYNAPLKDFVRYYKGGYILKVPFVENVKEMTVDNLQVKVILPEGATDIQIIPPSTFEMNSIQQTTHYTYFDSTGRPAIIFHKKNVVVEHEQPILISYKFSSVKLLQKPLVTSAGLFILCLFSIFVSKLPWAMNGGLLEEEEEEEVVVSKGGKVSTGLFPKGTILVDDSPAGANNRRKKSSSVILHTEEKKATTTAIKEKVTSRKKNNKKGQ